MLPSLKMFGVFLVLSDITEVRWFNSLSYLFYLSFFFFYFSCVYLILFSLGKREMLVNLYFCSLALVYLSILVDILENKRNSLVKKC